MGRAECVVVRAVLLAGLMGAQAFGIELTRDDAIGAKFNAPGPRVCSTMSEPQEGPLTVEQARAYVICTYEVDYQGGSEQLYLLGDVQVQILDARPNNYDQYDQIDPSKTVYDIAGTSVAYECVLSSVAQSPDQQCTRTPNANDRGLCYQILSGDWRCSWSDPTVPMSNDTNRYGPAPTEAEAE